MNSKLIALKESILFFYSSCCSFLLRNARFIGKYPTAGLGDLWIFALSWRASILSRPGKKRWKLPLWLNLLTLLKWDAGNFVFFGALYLGSLYGAASLTRYLYLPYLAGMILSMFLGKRVLRLFTRCYSYSA